MVAEQLDDGAAEDIGGEPLLSVVLLAGLAPVGGCELEDAGYGPAREQAEEIAEVGPWFDAVEPAAGQQRDEGGVDLGRVVVADEAPVAPTDDLSTQGQLAGVVVQRQPAVLEESLQRGPQVGRSYLT